MNTDTETAPAPMADFLAEFRRLAGIPLDAPPPAWRTQDEDRELIQASRRNQRLDRFRKLCPEEFRAKIDPARITNPKAWAEADAWGGVCPGLWLWSHATGHCKTRMLWRKFGQLHVDRGLAVVRITGANLAEEYHDAFNRSRTDDFYAQFRKFDAIMLDDLDKLALDDPSAPFGQRDQGLRNGRMIREVFDKFYENHTAVLVTANEPIDFFAARVGPSAERRMREVCREIEF